MRAYDLGILVGEATGGGAASPREEVDFIPGLSFRVSTVVLYPPDDNQSEHGLAPDVAVVFTPDDLKNGLDSERGTPSKDKVLSEALAWIEANL